MALDFKIDLFPLDVYKVIVNYTLRDEKGNEVRRFIKHIDRERANGWVALMGNAIHDVTIEDL